jgi:hypothetical protein
MPKRATLVLSYALFVLLACDFFAPPPTLTPTFGLSAPTLPPTQIVRGEVPTLPPQNLGMNDPTAAAVQSGGELPPLAVGTVANGEVKQPVQITSADGKLIQGSLYSVGDTRVPGLLMIAPDSTAWLDLPLRLNAAGFTVLAVNLSDLNGLADFNVLLQSLISVPTTDPGTLGVIGAEGGADMALSGCAAAPLCDAVALVSPVDQQADMLAVGGFSPRPLFVAAGTNDSVSSALASELANTTSGPKQLEQRPDSARGTQLIQNNPDIGDELIRWLQDQMKQPLP